LAPDDVAAICAAYPSDRVTSAVCNFEPERGYASDCGGDVEGSCHFAPRARIRASLVTPSIFLALATAALTRRRRTRR
jgi:hypothetical protein